MSIPNGGSAAHLAALSHHDRNRRQAELNASARAGTVFEDTMLDMRLARDVVCLVSQNRSRHGRSGGPELIERSLRAQREAEVLDDAYACVAFRDSKLTAITVCYGWHDQLYARYYGFNYRTAKAACEYFVLTYGTALDSGAVKGFRQYRLSVDAQALKLRRGARLSLLAAVVIPVQGTVCGTADAERYNRQFVQNRTNSTKSRPRCMTDEWAHWPTSAPQLRHWPDE